MSKDPVIINLEKALQLEQQGQTAQAVTMAKHLWHTHRSHPASLQAALIWARAESANPDAIFAVSMSYLLQGQFKEALQGMTLVTQLNPQHSDAFAMAGIAARSIGDLLLSIELTEKAMAMDPKNNFAVTNMLDILYDQGDFERALEFAEVATKKFPNEAGLFSNAARIYAKVGQHEKAIQHHQHVIRLAPTNAGLRVNYLGYLLEIHNYDLMQRELEKAYQTFKNNISTQRMHGMAWQHVRYMHALEHKKLLEPTDKILTMHDMEKIGTEHDCLKLVDKSHPAWLFEANNLYCHTTDWAYYGENDIFLNHKVTGIFFVFLMTYGINGMAYIQENFPRVTIDEPCLLLGGVDNYYHWLIDYLPRLAVLDYYPHLKDLPIYISDKNAAFQWESFDMLGIARDRIKTIPANHIAQVKHGYIAHIPGRPMYESGEPIWMAPSRNPFNTQWLREHLMKDIPAPTEKKRYFISREHTRFRRCINEARLFELAAEKGFEKLLNEGKNLREQIAIYAQADGIIGPHGAGFTNMTFAPKGTKIIEMFPKNRALDFYSAIAEQLDQPYVRLEGLIQRTFMDKGPDFGDFTIAEEDFKNALDNLF